VVLALAERTGAVLVGEAKVAALATEYARAQEREPVDLPQGRGRRRFAGIRAIMDINLPAPLSPTVVASFNLEPEDSEQIDDLVRGGFVRVAFDC
jgi:hypothetical protein